MQDIKNSQYYNRLNKPPFRPAKHKKAGATVPRLSYMHLPLPAQVLVLPPQPVFPHRCEENQERRILCNSDGMWFMRWNNKYLSGLDHYFPIIKSVAQCSRGHHHEFLVGMRMLCDL